MDPAYKYTVFIRVIHGPVKADPAMHERAPRCEVVGLPIDRKESGHGVPRIREAVGLAVDLLPSRDRQAVLIVVAVLPFRWIPSSPK